jgi:hypothetical protein
MHHAGRKKYAFILDKPYRWEEWAAPGTNGLMAGWAPLPAAGDLSLLGMLNCLIVYPN